MRKLLTGGLAALTAAAMIGATATPAAAEPHGGFRGGFRGGEFRGGRGDWGWGVGAGLAGFALGAAIANPNYYYGPGYYYGGPYYGPYDGDATCVGHRRVWDPYVGGYVIRRFYYAC